MRPDDLHFAKDGTATIHCGSQSFDLWRQHPGGPVQVCEFPVYQGDSDAGSVTYWINTPERLAEFLVDKDCSADQREAA